ncbi:uncharacterized protein LOC119993692 isoform X1 [Tripterygium wilfordii]|uniref:uncharacterized protein LOC119993692 isoform X1 n=1 Tax=Tripterygium wilfordii TaxID=458696 RepID=UPI0018F84273|nr:uncharacterized protein LOC119993692 isoform X1 [Tripterygium wilfordii]
MQKEARISQIYLGTRQVVCTSVLQLSFAWSILRYVLPRLSRLAVSYDPQSPVFCMEHSEIWIAPSFKCAGLSIESSNLNLQSSLAIFNSSLPPPVSLKWLFDSSRECLIVGFLYSSSSGE